MTTIFASLCLFIAIWVTLLLITDATTSYVTRIPANLTKKSFAVCLFWTLFYLLNNL